MTNFNEDERISQFNPFGSTSLRKKIITIFVQNVCSSVMRHNNPDRIIMPTQYISGLLCLITDVQTFCTKIVIIFLFIRQNLCFRFSKEQSQ